MPSTYILANVKVTNPTQYEEYRKWSTAAMQACGAEVCVRGGALHKDPLRTVLPPGAVDPRSRAADETAQTKATEAVWRGIHAARRAAKKPDDDQRVIASMSPQTAFALNRKTGGALFSPDCDKVLRESGALFDHEK